MPSSDTNTMPRIGRPVKPSRARGEAPVPSRTHQDRREPSAHFRRLRNSYCHPTESRAPRTSCALKILLPYQWRFALVRPNPHRNPCSRLNHPRDRGSQRDEASGRLFCALQWHDGLRLAVGEEPLLPLAARPHEDHRATDDEEHTGELHEVRADTSVLAQPEVFVERTL